jgi:hypothetical protein
MAKQEDELDGGFSKMSGLLSGKIDGKDYDNDHIPLRNPEEFDYDEDEEVDNESNNEEDGKKSKSKSKENVEEADGSDAESDESADSSDEVRGQDEEEVSLSEEDLPEIISFFLDEFSKELGWEFKDEEKPTTMKGLLDYMQSVIDENSQPRYPSDDIQALADFVEKGGDLKEFYDKVYGDLDPNKINLDSVSNQRKVIRENFKARGYTDIKIDKLLTRYEEAGTLEEEAEDALELLKEYKKETAEKLLQDQEKIDKDTKKRNQDFISSVENSIKKAENIRGVPISDKDKKDLIKYIFEIGNDGKTKYQSDYEKSHLNLIESAYFTMKGDTFVQQVQKKATSEAAKNLKLKLKAKGKVNKNTADDADETNSNHSLWDQLSSNISNRSSSRP